MVKNRLCFCAVLLLLFGFVFAANAAPQELSCPNLSVEVTLTEDGSAAVLERWTLNTPETVGSFSRFVAAKEGQQLSEWEVIDRKGEELNLPYTPVTAEGEPVPSTYRLTDGEGGTTVEWFFTPEEKSRSFLLGYKVKNAVLCHADVADYTASFSDADHPFVLESVSVKIMPTIPGGETLTAEGFLHGTLENEIKLSAGALIITGKNVPPKTPLEIRALLPTAYFPNQVADAEVQKDVLVTEEEEVRHQAETAPVRFWIFWGVLIALALFIILTGLLIRGKTRRICKRYGVDNHFDPDFDSPQMLLPAALPDFYYFYSPKAEDLRGKRVIATLLDLFARGNIAIGINKDESLLARDNVVFTKKEDLPADAPEAEKILFSLLFETVSGGAPRCTVADLVRYGRQNREGVGECLSAFDAASRRAFNEYGYAENLTRHKRVPLLCSVLSFVLAAVGVAAAFTDLRILVLVPALILCGVLTGGCLSLRRLTEEGESAFIHWHTYRHFLKDFSEAEELPAFELWEHLFINAAALGVLDRVLPQVRERIRVIPNELAFPHFTPLMEDGGMETLLATASVFDGFPHARLHTYHED